MRGLLLKRMPNNLDTTAKNVIRAYFGFLDSIVGTDEYNFIDSNPEACIELLRHSLCKVCAIRSEIGFPEISSLAPSCAEYISGRVKKITYMSERDRELTFQLCVHYIVQSRNRVRGIGITIDPDSSFSLRERCIG